MALNNHDQAKIRQYLLGQLNADEQQKMEERLMVDDDLFQELEVSQSEVVEEYSAGELTAKERAWLEQHFLASRTGRQEQTFAIALDRLKTNSPKPPTFVERLQNIWGGHRWSIALAASATAVVVITIATLINRPATPVTIALVSSAQNRGESLTPTKVRLSSRDELTVQLILPQPANAADVFRVELDNTNEIRSVAIAAQDANSLQVVFPSSELPKGRYELTIYAAQAGGNERQIPGTYRFDVE